MSETKIIHAVVGEEFSCRFELKSSASEKESVFLTVQSNKSAEDEVRQLIECPVKIAFAADFGI